MLKILIKREIVYFYLKKPVVILLSFVILMFVLPTSSYPMFYLKAKSQNTALILSALFPAIIIILIGQQSLWTQIYQEKVKRNIEIFLGLGFSPLKIWLAKIISMAIVNYILYLICMMLTLFGLSIIAPINIQYLWDAIFLTNLFIISPLLGLSILGVNGMLYLLFSEVRFVNLLLIIVTFFFFFFFRKISGIIVVKNMFNFVVYHPFMVVVFMIFSIFICSTILRIVPTERYLQ